MRFVVKAAEPLELTEWRTSGNTNWQPTYGGLQAGLKDRIRRSLLGDQGYVCCYCERRVANDPGVHIEHLVPQSKRPDLALHYSNMLCSCSSKHHCGHARGNSELPVNPLESDCGDVFDFRSNGAVDARQGPRSGDAHHAIQVLNLDTDSLRDRRRRAVDAFLGEMAHEPPSTWSKRVLELLGSDVTGRFVPHATAVVAVVRRNESRP